MNGMTGRTLDRYTRALGTALKLAEQGGDPRNHRLARACLRGDAHDVAELARRIGAMGG